MKILKPSFSILMLLVLATSCKKNDFLDENVPTETAASAPELSLNTDSSAWYSSSKWDIAAQEDFSVHYINVADNKITADVVDNGLVLVFKQNSAGVAALPVEESGKGESQYWYHQVTEGNLLISADTYGGAKAPDASSTFKYFILTSQSLKTLEANGYTLDRLMGLSYQEASELL
ncbi:MAG TPA: hypothetical protein VM843_03350 [Flavisolibacter sp.]|nr:hypothetical protein [Flavisolibacter sp.]